MPRRRDRHARESVGSCTAGNPEVRTETGPHPRNRDVSTLESHTYIIIRACDVQTGRDLLAWGPVLRFKISPGGAILGNAWMCTPISEWDGLDAS